jgi:hypothetical protein
MNADDKRLWLKAKRRQEKSEPKFTLIERAWHSGEGEYPDGRSSTIHGIRAKFRYGNEDFWSRYPYSIAQANAINMAVEEITGIEIATILKPK